MTTATLLIQAAYREGNLIAVGLTPSAAELLEALPALNRYVKGIFGYEMGEPLADWLVPSPQRTAAVPTTWPQLPYPLGVDSSFQAFNITGNTNVYQYPPANSRLVFGNVVNTVYFPDAPRDGARMALVAGSGKGDAGVPGTAAGTLTQTVLPVAATVVVLGATTYTWVAALSGAANEVLIGLTIANSLANLAAAIIAGEGNGAVYGLGTLANTSVSASSNSSLGTLTATALQAGAGGNAIASTTTDAHGTWTGATLSGGVVGSILTIDGNGRLINGAPQQQYTSPVPNMEWIFRADLGQWIPVQDMTVTDNCPFPAEFDDYFICGLNKRLCPRYGKTPAPDTLDTSKRTLARLKARYRQAANTTYGSENMPQSGQSFHNIPGSL